MAGLGYTLAAEARRIGYYHPTAQRWVTSGNVDLVEGAVDRIYVKLGSRTLFVSITHAGSESPRRAKMRAAPLDPAHCEGILAAWDLNIRAYRVYRDVDNYLQPPTGGAWLIARGATRFPWEKI